MGSDNRPAMYGRGGRRFAQLKLEKESLAFPRAPAWVVLIAAAAASGPSLLSSFPLSFGSTSEFPVAAAASVFSVRRPSVTRTYFQFAMHVSYSSLPSSLLRSMALRAGGGRHAMQSPPLPPSPLLAAKKVDFRQLRDSMLCTIMRAAASAAADDDVTHSEARSL